MRALGWILLSMVAGACSIGPVGPRDDDTGDADTDVSAGTCPADVELLQMALCLSTTAAGFADTDETYTEDNADSVTGAVVATGPYAALDAETAVTGFEYGCGSDDLEEMVRVADEDGNTWTIAWSIAGDADAGSHGLFAADEALTVEWASWLGGYAGGSGVAIHDASGLRYVFDVGLALSAEQLAGLAVERGDECTWFAENGAEYTMTALVFDGTVSVHSGQSGTIGTDADALDVVVPYSGWNEDCADGCGTAAWAGWR